LGGDLKTYIASEKEVESSKKWFVIDANDLVLGRLASKVALILKGKHKPTYSPHYDVGDFVVVINAEKIKLTGKKMLQKTYFRHTGYPGGEKITPVKLMLQRHPDRVIEFAVKGMLPKNSLGRSMLKKLKVYAGENHPHSAQQPKELSLN
jgi:large subunit ribosomal protein L13